MLSFQLLTQITELKMSIRLCSKLETITAVKTHVRAAINLAKAMECQTEERTLCIKRKVSPNQNFEKQFKFFSTKMSENPVLTKPPLIRVRNVKKLLVKLIHYSVIAASKKTICIMKTKRCNGSSVTIALCSYIYHALNQH